MRYRPEIDGLRAIAVLPVILFHAGFKAFSGGFVGVDVFFVISGFLITSIILNDELEKKFSIVNFYERRARRILPALFFVMLVSLPFAWFWLIPDDFKKFSHSLAGVSVYLSNFLFWHESGYFDLAAELKPLLHTWSLAVEEQFYLLFPLLLIFAIRRLKIKKSIFIVGLIALSSLALAQWSAYAYPTFAYFMLPTRAWELMLGALTAIYFTHYSSRYPINSTMLAQSASFAGLALITLAVFLLNQHTPFPGFYALIPTLGTVLVILFAHSNTFVGKWLGTRAFVGIGLVSYSAYLWHQPIFAFARHRSLQEVSSELYLALAVLSFILAYFTWKYIEAPFRDRKRFSRKHIFIYSAIFSLFFIAFGVAGHFSNGFEKRFSPMISKVASPPSFYTGQIKDCHREGNSYAKLDESCVLGDSKHVIGALIGDSHANALSTQLGKDLTTKQIGLVQLTFNGCPSMQNVYRSDMDENNKCSEFNAQVLSYLKAHPNLEYIVVASRWTRFLSNQGFVNGEGGVEKGDDSLDVIEDGVRQHSAEQIRIKKIKQKIKEEFDFLVHSGKKIILVYPIPEVGWRAPDYLVKQRIFNIRPINNTTDYHVFLQRNKVAIDALDAIGVFPNLARVYPHKILCNSYISSRCVFELHDEPLYFDTNHLSNAGASMVNRDIIRAIDALSEAP